METEAKMSEMVAEAEANEAAKHSEEAEKVQGEAEEKIEANEKAIEEHKVPHPGPTAALSRDANSTSRAHVVMLAQRRTILCASTIACVCNIMSASADPRPSTIVTSQDRKIPCDRLSSCAQHRSRCGCWCCEVACIIKSAFEPVRRGDARAEPGRPSGRSC